MRNTFVVAWKEFRTFFQTSIGWVILILFSLVGGLFFFNFGHYFQVKTASLRTLFEFLPWIFLWYAPAVTMRLWAEERRTGTVETLLTLPLQEWQIVVGKYLAAVGLVAVYLVCLTPLAGVVLWTGANDLGPILGGFLGALLLGSAFAAIGVAASSVTENQIISLVVSLVASFVFLMIGSEGLLAVLPEVFQRAFSQLSLRTHFDSICRGVVDSRDVVFYLSFIAFFLTLNTWAVRRKDALLVTTGLVGALLLFGNYLTQGLFARVDLTHDGRYSLATASRRILSNLEDDLRVTAYLSSDLPQEAASIPRDVEDKLKEFQAYSGPHLHVEIVDPSKSDEKKKAAENAGVRPTQFNATTESKVDVRVGYIGVVVEFGSKSESVPPDLNPRTGTWDTLEYDLMRYIAKMTRKGAVKVAWQVNDPYAGMNIPGMQRPPTEEHSPTVDLRMIDEQIKQVYETTTTDLKSKVPDDVKVVLLCNADALNEVQKFHLDQFLMRGGSVVVMADGTEQMSFGGMGGRGSPFNRSAAQKLPADFFSHYGFKINNDVVLDVSCREIPIQQQLAGMNIQAWAEYPPWVVALRHFAEASHPVSAQVGNLAMLFPSSISLDPKPGVKKFELVKSTPKATHRVGFIDLDPKKMVDEERQEGFTDQFKEQFVLVGLLEGEFQSYFQAHPIPKEITDPKDAKAADPDKEGELPIGAEPVLPSGDDAVHAKEHAKDDSKPKDDAKKDESKAKESSSDGTASKDGGAKPPDASKPAEKDEKKSGGPPVDEQDAAERDVPGGGIVRVQDAPAPAPAKPSAPPTPPIEAPKGEAPKADASKAEAPKKEFDFLKKSPPTARIFVLPTSEFVSDHFGAVGSGRFTNDLFLQSMIDYSVSEDLSSLRVKNVEEPMFQDPSPFAKNVAIGLTGFGPPLLLAGAWIFVVVWRKSIRPAAARRRMSARAS